MARAGARRLWRAPGTSCWPASRSISGASSPGGRRCRPRALLPRPHRDVERHAPARRSASSTARSAAEAEAVLVARAHEAGGSRPLDSRGAGGVRGRARRLLESLFRPLSLGPAELPNRIVSTSHQTNLVRDHLPTADFVAYHEARARGGAGLIVLEATAVAPVRPAASTQPGRVRGRIVDGYRRVAEAVRRARHAALRAALPRRPGANRRARRAHRSLAPSAIPSQRFKTEPRPLADEEIDALVAAYGAAAERAAAGGLDGVEISAAHNYLVAQFFTPGAEQADGPVRCRPCLPARRREARCAARARDRARRPARRPTRRPPRASPDELAGARRLPRPAPWASRPPTAARRGSCPRRRPRKARLRDLAESFRVGPAHRRRDAHRRPGSMPTH